MSRKATLTDRNMMKITNKNAARIKALVAEYPDGGDWQDYANDIIETYLNDYRSKKPLVLPDERFTERRAEGEWEWEGVCL